MRLLRSQHWIPPEALLFAQLSLLASWVLLYAVGRQGAVGASPVALAWLHTIVLGWLTTTALAFLIHVLPTFTETPLKLQRLARGALWLFEGGVVAMVVGFAIWKPTLIASGGGAVAVAVFAALTSFIATTAAAFRSDDSTVRAVARAFFIVFVMLALTVAIGFAMSAGVAGGDASLLRFALVHATFGVFGWLMLLVLGVSMRTYNALLGYRIGRKAHISASSFVLGGIVIAVVGLLASQPNIAIAGGYFVIAGALIADLATMRGLRLATAEHRLPREFVAASAFWLLVAVVYGAASMFGLNVSAAMLVAVLLGWIGQNVNAHMMHVGIRLLATIVISGDDETQPRELLNRGIGITSWALWQIAVGAAVVGVGTPNGTLLEIAGVVGFAATLAMLANIIYAARQASKRRLKVGGAYA